MVLIVGGEGSGKRTFAESLGFTRAEMADAVLDDRPVVYHVERMTLSEAAAAQALLEPLSNKAIVICNEIGSGIIPMEHEKRLAREATGRLCIQLAQRADCVVRMVCGLPTVIKGTLPTGSADAR